nr:hypothetical protein [Tanacetum cinerariifolium]
MRPFRCIVMILNTIDHLGKFDGKADEGFFVRYSLNSKAFRVFNSRTRIVEENLHIRFSESTPNVVGSGPNWLFDIDVLTRAMNYEPIVTGTQSNGFADPKSSHDDGSKPSSDDGKKVNEDLSKESKCNDQEKEENVNSTFNVNIVNVASTNDVNADGGIISSKLSFDPNMPALEDVGIFDFSSDDKDDGAVADMNNLDITIQVSPTPSTRIHKDHPLDKVIGDFHSATQTRKMSKNLEEHGFVSSIQQRTNHKDLQNCLFACFLSQEEPKNVIYALKDPSWMEAMQEELLQFKLQEELCIAFEKFMHEKFQMSSMREHTFFLELQVKQKKNGTFISQDKCVAKILKKFRFTEVKTVSTPMETQKPLIKDKDGEEVDVHMYRYQVNLKVSHLYVVKRIFMYLKGQPKLGLWYPKDSLFDLVAYIDSDYARANLDKKSTTGEQLTECKLPLSPHAQVLLEGHVRHYPGHTGKPKAIYWLKICGGDPRVQRDGLGGCLRSRAWIEAEHALPHFLEPSAYCNKLRITHSDVEDTRTMPELLQAPTEGYGDAVIPTILAKNFELKVRLLSLVTSGQFHCFKRDDPHSHIRWFMKITYMLKYKNVPHDAIKLMRFPFSLEGAARTWLEKEPPRFSELHQIDAFYNALTQFDQDSLNATADGNILNRTPRDALTIIENKSKVRTSRNKPVVSKVNTTTSSSSPFLDITALIGNVKELVLMNIANQQASVKAVEETSVTCGGPHPYYECLDTDSNTFNASATTRTYNQGGLELCMALADLGVSINLMPLFVWKKLSLPDLTPTRMTPELPTRSFPYPAGIAEDIFVQVGKFTFPANFVFVDYDTDPRIPLILGRPFLRTTRALVDVHGEELILRDGDEKMIFHADSTPKHPHKHGNESINMINFTDITCKDRFPKVLKFKKSNHPTSGSTTPLCDFSPSLTPFETSDSLLDEFTDELALFDPFPPGKEDNNFYFEANPREIEYLLNQDPLTEFNIETIDPILKKFTAEPALDYLPPAGDEDDDLFDLNSNNNKWKKLLYGDCYKDIDSEKDKNKDTKMKSLVVKAHIVKSNDLLP